MQITNSFINKHGEQIKYAAYAGTIKEARLQLLQHGASRCGVVEADCYILNAP